MPMAEDDFNEFFRTGKLLEFGQNTTADWIVDKLGNPEEVEEYGNKGRYLHYGNLRLSITNGFLDRVTIFFMNYSDQYELRIGEEKITINKNTPICSILKTLNQLNLRWNIPYESSKLDYALIEVLPCIKIYYYLENGMLERIESKFLFSLVLCSFIKI
jgi:hypothetical protein